MLKGQLGWVKYYDNYISGVWYLLDILNYSYFRLFQIVQKYHDQ